MNEELRAIYVADQDDRSQGVAPQDLVTRDAARRARVEQLMNAGALESADDYYHAAMVFQHGGSPEHTWRAHVLARTAAELGYSGADQWHQARWLAAAAYDRWLVQQGKLQRYGTQYRAVEGHWELFDVDPSTTDAERAEWGVPALHEARARAEERTRVDPPRLYVDGLRLWPLTARARRVLAAADAEATRLGHRFVGPEHLLLGILTEAGGAAAHVIDSAAGTEVIRSRLLAIIGAPGHTAGS